MFYFVEFDCCLIEPCSFLMRDRKGADLEEKGGNEEVGGVGEGKL